MNPLISKSLDNLKANTNITEVDLHFVMLELGNFGLNVAAAVKHNPNANLNGGDSIDENTIGNFEIEELPCMLSKCMYDLSFGNRGCEFCRENKKK